MNSSSSFACTCSFLLFLLKGLKLQGLFSILFSLHTLLKKGSKRAAGWVSGSLPRSTHYISSWRVSIILPVISMGLSSPKPPPPFLKLLLSTSSFHLLSQLLWRSHSVPLLLVFFSSSTCQVLGSFMFKYKFSHPVQTKKLPIYFLPKVKISVNLIIIFSWCQVWADN